MRDTTVRLLVAAALIAAAIAAYSGPVVALWNAADRAVPAWSSSDQTLYLVFSTLEPDPQGRVRNPWYGNVVPAAGVDYLRFGLSFSCFRALTRLSGSLPVALIVWHALFAALIAVSALWMLEPVFRGHLSRAIATSALLFVDLAWSWRDLLQIRRGHVEWLYGLPFGRAFFPQFAIPLLLLALGALIRWNVRPRRSLIAVVIALQFVGFVSFPYVSMIIVAVTFLVLVASAVMGKADRRHVVHGGAIVAVGLALDLAWLLWSGSGVRPPGMGELFVFDPSRLHLGLRLLAPLLLAAGALLLRRGALEARIVFGFFSLTVFAIQLSDAFLSPAMQLAHHADYFQGLALLLPLLALATAISWRPIVLFRPLLLIGILSFATLESIWTFRTWENFNRENGELARALTRVGATTGDLVIEPVHGFRTRRAPQYWEASWIPLRFEATVLYSRAATFLLPGDFLGDRDRLVEYLRLLGESEESMASLLASNSDATFDQWFVAGYGREHLLASSSRARVLSDLRKELLPRFRADKPPSILVDARRVIIVDWTDAPMFKPDAIARRFETDQMFTEGAWTVRVGRTRRP